MRGILRQAELFAWRLASYFDSDDAYQRHAQMVDATLEQLHNEGKDSRTQHSIQGADGLNHWSPARRRQQQQALKYLRDKYANTPRNGEAVVVGGPPGSGKTTVANHPLIGLNNHMRLDVDEMKHVMAMHGMVPEVPGLSPMEASSLVHREAGDLVNQLARTAYANKQNVLWDHTMSNDEGLEKQINDIRQAGYNKVNGILVKADPLTARGRTEERHRGEESTYRLGQGDPQKDLGGRWVPSSVSRHNLPQPGQPSRSEQVFAKHQPSFDSTATIESGDTPTVTHTTGPDYQHLEGGQLDGNST